MSSGREVLVLFVLAMPIASVAGTVTHEWWPPQARDHREERLEVDAAVSRTEKAMP